MDTLLTSSVDPVVSVFPTDRIYGTAEAIRAVMPYADIRPDIVYEDRTPEVSFGISREDVIHIVHDEVKRILLSIPQFSNINVDDFL